MINSAKTVNIKLLDVPVQCYYPAFKKDKTLPYEYYKTVLINDDLYTVEEYAVVNGGESIEVVKLICIFTNHERKIQIVVRKYILARNLREELVEEGCTTFDDNEVVEDFTGHYVISAERILRKCCMVFAEQDEGCIISRSNLNSLSYFSCRYMLKSEGLFPILSIPQIVLSELNSKSPKRSPKQKRKFGMENIPLTSLDDPAEGNALKKIKSPRNKRENLKIDSNICSPIQRNSVKRNLNKSFGDSPKKTSKSILNYSIVTDDELDDSLVLKLKISEKNKIPLVVLKKYNDSNYSMVLRPKQNEIQLSPVRKSTRVRVRKSYADYISPIKITPRKRGITQSDIESEEERGSENSTLVTNSARGIPSRKTEEGLKMAVEDPLEEKNALERRLIKTPRQYQHEKTESRYNKNSVRRSLRLTSAETVVTTPHKTTNTNKRRNSPNPDKGGVKNSATRTPEKKANLDESIRRSVLRGRFRNARLEEETKSPDSSHKIKSRNRPKNFFYETSSDSEESDEENSKSKVKTVNGLLPIRTCRQPTVVINSETLDSEEPIRKTPKTRRILKNIDGDISASYNSPQGTPKTGGRKDSAASEKPTPKTPSRKSNVKTPKTMVTQTPKTPRNRAKLIRDGVITPSMQSRSKSIVENSTPLIRARSQLHVSYVPIALPCREREYSDVFNFLEGKLLEGCGGCMYISGVPGTGKTATVTSVINNLLKDDSVPNFSYVCVNGMRLTEPRQSYVEILRQLTGKTVPWEQAQSILEERFTKSRKSPPIVMLVDELDVLCTKRQDVVYNLLDWPTKATNQLIVISIANTMDLPERLLMSRVTSRLGLTRLTFHAYTHKQLQEIVTKRLFGTDSFNPDAIQLVARKVASVSGDARRALDICRRAAEIAESEGKCQLVNMNHVNEALNAMITQPKVRAIKYCSRLEQLILQSIVAEVERTGVEETTVMDVFKMLISCATIDGFRMVSNTVVLSAISRLSACRLILTDQKCNDINQRIILNVSIDDVYYALKKEKTY